MKKRISLFIIGVAFSLSLLFSLQSCEDEKMNLLIAKTLIQLLAGNDVSTLFGWDEVNENLNEIESDIDLSDSDDLPSSIDLTPHFPPIGNQGAYGTCVAWAVGYNLHSFLKAKEGGYKPTAKSQQYSPKDLFFAISSSKKGADCNGTNFEPALDISVSRGIAPLSSVPYENLGKCKDTPPSSWTRKANEHKIDSYRKIKCSVSTVKNYLAKGRPVVIGAKLGDNFMRWNNNSPISSDTYSNPGMQHAYHAMIVSGYSNSKQAFRVVNSWDTGWGDNGYIWVDYDFFQKSFCFAAFVAKNKATDNPDENNDNKVDPDEIANGNDLVAWELYDFDDPESDDETKRTIKYNVFNSGNTAIPASKDWNIIYVYYNAYDANDYGILLYDYYTDDFGKNGDDGNFDDVGKEGDGISDSWWNHVDAPAGQSIAEALYGGSDARFNWGYYMPESITGKYFLVLIADGYDAVKEVDEENNYFFFTKDNKEPVYIKNGIIDYNKYASKKAKSKPGKFADSPMKTPVTEKNVNTYKPEEIRRMLMREKKNGNLMKKVKAFKKRQNVRKTMSK